MSKRLSKKERRLKRMAGDPEKTKETLRRLDLELKEKKKRLNKSVSRATKYARIKKKKRSKRSRLKDITNYFKQVYQYDSIKIKEELERQPLGHNRLELIRSYNKFLRINLKDSKVNVSKEDIEKEYKLFFELYCLFRFNESRKLEKQHKKKTFYTKIIYTPAGNKR